MPQVVYRSQQGPGCGGCLLIFLLLVFLAGGGPLLLNVLGMLLYAGLFLFLALLAVAWGASWFLKKKVREYAQSQTESHNYFVSLFVQILVRVAQLDGKVSREEVATIKAFFQTRLHYDQNQLRWVKDLVKEAMESSVPLEALLQEVRARFAYEPRLLLLDLIYQVVFSNPEVRPEELDFVRRVGRYLELSPFDQRVVEMKYTGGYRPSRPAAREAEKEKRSFDLLGLAPGASFVEIKAAYRKLSMQYHPDKVRHLGEEFRAVAEEKMKEINDAYDFLEKRYGRAGGPGGA